MIKPDLLTGYLIITRNEKKGILMPTTNGGIFCWAEAPTKSWECLDNYNKNLTHKTDKGLDIIAIYGFSSEPRACAGFDTKNRTLLWNREQIFVVGSFDPEEVPYTF